VGSGQTIPRHETVGGGQVIPRCMELWGLNKHSTIWNCGSRSHHSIVCGIAGMGKSFHIVDLWQVSEKSTGVELWRAGEQFHGGIVGCGPATPQGGIVAADEQFHFVDLW